jgi:hypothetical protein
VLPLDVLLAPALPQEALLAPRRLRCHRQR